jgi:hypothetical protein
LPIEGNYPLQSMIVCPHLWEALRYTELNPVRAGLVAESESWMWSSAAAHCASDPAPGWLALEQWQTHWSAESWRAFLRAKEDESALAAMRLSTHTGHPLGTAEIVRALERSTQRPLAPQKRGTRPRAVANQTGCFIAEHATHRRERPKASNCFNIDPPEWQKPNGHRLWLEASSAFGQKPQSRNAPDIAFEYLLAEARFYFRCSSQHYMRFSIARREANKTVIVS